MELKLLCAWFSVHFDLPGEPNHSYLFNKQGKDFLCLLANPLNHYRKNCLHHSGEKLFNLLQVASHVGAPQPLQTADSSAFLSEGFLDV